MPNSRTALALGVRAALTTAGGDELARPVSLSRLRSIAVATPPASGAAQTEDYERRRAIESFLGVGSAEQNQSAGRLGQACAIVDRWLIYDRLSNPNGLPPVLVSSFARGSSPIYLFLLHLADRIGAGNPALESEWRRLLPGVCTLVHWFSETEVRLKIGDLLMRAVVRKTTPENVRKDISSAIAEKLIVRPREPSDTNKFIQLPKDDTLRDWEWWPSLIGSVPERWWLFLERTVWQREMLLFAQRGYLDLQFPTYDPSRKDLWENTNRPWDFDHLHADFYVRGKQGVYADFCRRWGRCIGNLRAWPFEDNRSDQKDTAKEKLSGKPDQIAASLIESEAGLEPFSLRESTRHDAAAARSLSEAIKSRYIKIYRNWYESTDIPALLPPSAGE